jgi:hypothetical protein
MVRASACHAVAAGSVSAATRAGRSCGMSISDAAGRLMYSAKAPGRLMPTMVRFAHRLLRPWTQYSHTPQVMSGLPVYLVPTATPGAADSATVPTNSWPSTSPGLRRGSCPCQACMSDPQMPTASMRSTTSPGSAAGMGRSWISASNGFV